jgi:hypothetical protein
MRKLMEGREAYRVPWQKPATMCKKKKKTSSSVRVYCTHNHIHCSPADLTSEDN